MATDPHAEIRANVANIDPAWTGELRALLADRDALSDALAAPPADTDPAIDRVRRAVEQLRQRHRDDPIVREILTDLETIRTQNAHLRRSFIRRSNHEH